MGERMVVAAQTDVGCRRQNNEDSFAYDLSAGIFAVSDGMGGSAGGEIASQLAVEQLIASYRLLREAQGEHIPSFAEALYHAVGSANAAVHARAQADAELRGMGATLVAMALEGNKAVIANVGDSRAYLLREGSSTQITADHSFVAEQVRAGLLTEEAAIHSPLRSTITRAVGIAPTVEADLFAAELAPGDRILLVSDGLTRYVADHEMAEVAGPSVSPDQACAALVELTRSRGAADNVTCLLLSCES
ncbi:MAG TPA: Stp1/IreP family PP2C-type Ser/Thr phosphatase [Acidobacteriaceae bacterium]